MPDWSGAPITQAALWPSPSERGPSALEREWATQLKHEGDFILLVSGCYRRREDCSSWSALWWNVSEPGKDPDACRAAAASDAAANVERLLAPLCREVRVRMLQELYQGPRSADELAAAVGLSGGAFASHLQELLEAAFVVKAADGMCSLTTLGCNLLLVVTSLAGVTVQDRGTDGLVIGDVG